MRDGLQLEVAWEADCAEPAWTACRYRNLLFWLVPLVSSAVPAGNPRLGSVGERILPRGSSRPSPAP